MAVGKATRWGARSFGTDTFMAIMLVGCALPSILLPSSPAGASGPDIATEMRRQMREVDEMALKVYSTPLVESARREVAAVLRSTSRAASSEAAVLIEPDAAEITFASVQMAVNEDARNPRVQWRQALAHRWGPLSIPAGRYGLDNPDNAYGQFPVDGESRYEIVGKMPPAPPSDVTFSVLDASSTETMQTRTLGLLKGTDIEVGADRTFTLTVGPEPGTNRNHLQTPPGSRLVMIRQTLADWNRETPIVFFVRRLAGTLSAPPDLEAISTRAAHLAGTNVRTWAVGYARSRHRDLAPNTMTPVVGSGALGGLATQMNAAGRFRLADDEALIIRTRTFGARYVSLQTGDPWLVSTEYVRRTGTLNNSQAVRNGDGSITFVVSIRDTGFCNWVDPGGLHEGYLALRFQDLPAGSAAGGPLLETRVVKSGALRHSLPNGSCFVTPARRRQQIAERIGGYNMRVRAIMGEK